MLSKSMIRRRAILFFLFLSGFALAGNLFAEESARVRFVIDGDTFILENNQRVRMIGIDAPEVTHHKYRKVGEPFGQESRDHLRGMIAKRVIELQSGQERFDRFGRRLAYVFLPDGTFVNRQMIVDGYAETFRKFSFQYKPEFMQLEKEARAKQVGMWGEKPKGFWARLRGRSHGPSKKRT